MTETVYIGIGSNLAEPLEQVSKAQSELAHLPQSRLQACAPCYRSRAVGPQGQPDYINSAARLLTTLSPEALLDALQAIEAGAGRERSLRWGPRTLDLDILLFGHEVINTPRLTIPHPQLPMRDFVLQPLLDLDAQLALPDGRTLTELRRSCPDNGLQRVPAKV